MFGLLEQGHSLEKPPVYGRLELDEFEVIHAMHSDVYATIGVQSDELQKLARKVARIAGLPTDDRRSVETRQKPVQPGSYQGNEYSHSFMWHFDGDYAALASDVEGLTTQFPLASAAALQNLARYVGRRLVIPCFPKITAARITNALNLVDDAVLENEIGIEIWSPEPGEIVGTSPFQIHRSALNLTNEAVDRAVIIVSDVQVRNATVLDYIR